jgi:starch phosphorylase
MHTETKSVEPRAAAYSTTQLNPDALTLGFARRFATYKRAMLIFRDSKRLERILNQVNQPVQIIFGKAHPADEPGKSFIQQVVQRSREQGFAENYIYRRLRHQCGVICAGVDVWLNNPRRPQEASGTSGQKASLNGIPNFSVLDGWWREGFIRDVNGWAIGEDQTWDDTDAQDANDAESFYTTLGNEIVPLYYQRDADGIPHGWVRKMKAAIKTIAPRFSAAHGKRYVKKYYLLL